MYGYYIVLRASCYIVSENNWKFLEADAIAIFLSASHVHPLELYRETNLSMTLHQAYSRASPPYRWAHIHAHLMTTIDTYVRAPSLYDGTDLFSFIVIIAQFTAASWQLYLSRNTFPILGDYHTWKSSAAERSSKLCKWFKYGLTNIKHNNPTSRSLISMHQ